MRSSRGAFQVASFRGIPIRLHYSLLLALPLLALIYGSVVRQAAREAHVVPELSRAEPFLWGLGVAVGLFASVLLHELAHVFYALRTGGQVRSITLMIVGGVSEVTELPRRHRDEVLMALVGPVMSLVLGVGLLALVALLPGSLGFTPRFAVTYLGGLNILLGLFNLLPAFPMDGGRILRGLLAGRMGLLRATRVASGVGKGFAGLFFLAGLLTLNPFLFVIALVVLTGAEGEAQQVRARAVLEKLRVEQVMTPRFHGVELNTSVAEALGDLRRARRPALPATENDVPVGWVLMEALLQVPEPERARCTVRELLQRAEAVSPEDDVWAAARRMVEAKPPLLLVLERGRLVGTLDGNDINAALTLHQASEEGRPGGWPRWRQERPA